MIFPKVVARGQLGRRGKQGKQASYPNNFFSRGFAKPIVFYLFSKLKWISQVLALPPLEPMWTSSIHNTL